MVMTSQSHSFIFFSYYINKHVPSRVFVKKPHELFNLGLAVTTTISLLDLHVPCGLCRWPPVRSHVFPASIVFRVRLILEKKNKCKHKIIWWYRRMKCLSNHNYIKNVQRGIGAEKASTERYGGTINSIGDWSDSQNSKMLKISGFLRVLWRIS